MAPLKKPKLPPRWGATKKQGEQYARMRSLHEHIHKLETENAFLKEAAADADERLACIRGASGINRQRVDALKAVCGLSVTVFIQLGLMSHAQVLCAWLKNLEETCAQGQMVAK